MNVNTDRLIADAKSLPELVASASAEDPALAQQLTGKALLSSRTVKGTAVTMVVSWLVSRYAIGWDGDTCALVSGLAVMGATTGLRWITRGPITGLLNAKGPSQ